MKISDIVQRYKICKNKFYDKITSLNQKLVKITTRRQLIMMQ